jgi:hypothetical protein
MGGAVAVAGQFGTVDRLAGRATWHRGGIGDPDRVLPQVGVAGQRRDQVAGVVPAVASWRMTSLLGPEGGGDRACCGVAFWGRWSGPDVTAQVQEVWLRVGSVVAVVVRGWSGPRWSRVVSG